MIDPNHPELCIQRQCELLGISRSSYYYEPKAISSEELTLLRLLDEQYMKTPFYGSRKMAVYLNTLGYEVNRKRVIRLMNQLGIQAIYPKKRTTVRNPEHQIYPVLPDL